MNTALTLPGFSGLSFPICKMNMDTSLCPWPSWASHSTDEGMAE